MRHRILPRHNSCKGTGKLALKTYLQNSIHSTEHIYRYNLFTPQNRLYKVVILFTLIFSDASLYPSNLSQVTQLSGRHRMLSQVTREIL